MTKRLSILLVTLLAVGSAVAGCGDDGDEARNDTSPPAVQSDGTNAEQQKPDTTQRSDRRPKSGDSGGSRAAETPAARQATEDCKDQVEANPQASGKVKTKVGDICQEAATGDRKGTTKAAQEACKALIKESVPAGPARQKALRSCDRTPQR